MDTLLCLRIESFCLKNASLYAKGVCYMNPGKNIAEGWSRPAFVDIVPHHLEKKRARPPAAGG